MGLFLPGAGESWDWDLGLGPGIGTGTLLWSAALCRGVPPWSWSVLGLALGIRIGTRDRDWHLGLALCSGVRLSVGLLPAGAARHSCPSPWKTRGGRTLELPGVAPPAAGARSRPGAPGARRARSQTRLQTSALFEVCPSLLPSLPAISSPNCSVIDSSGEGRAGAAPGDAFGAVFSCSPSLVPAAGAGLGSPRAVLCPTMGFHWDQGCPSQSSRQELAAQQAGHGHAWGEEFWWIQGRNPPGTIQDIPDLSWCTFPARFSHSHALRVGIKLQTPLVPSWAIPHSHQI